jgi:hypothetical protein
MYVSNIKIMLSCKKKPLFEEYLFSSQNDSNILKTFSYFSQAKISNDIYGLKLQQKRRS